MLKLQTKEEKDEIDCFHGIEFWPHDPKVSAVINNFSKKPLASSPKFDSLALQYNRVNTKDETVKADNQSNNIKMICSGIPSRNQHSDYNFNSKNKFNQDSRRKKVTKKKDKPKLQKNEISIPIGAKHVAGITKGVSLIENRDLEHAINELLKVAGLTEDLLSDQDVRNKLESICQENNFVATFQNYRVISNCFDGSVKVKRRKSNLNDSDEVNSKFISTDIIGSNAGDKKCSNVVSHEENDSNFPEPASQSPLQISQEEPKLEEIVIKDTTPSATDPSESVATNILVFSCQGSPEKPLASLDRTDNYDEVEPICSGEEMPSSGSLLPSILEVELKPIPIVPMKTSHRDGDNFDINFALDKAIQRVRQISRLSVCDDNGEEDDWSS